MATYWVYPGHNQVTSIHTSVTSWPHHGHILPHPGHILTTPWPYFGHILATSWPHSGHKLVTPQLQPDLDTPGHIHIDYWPHLLTKWPCSFLWNCQYSFSYSKRSIWYEIRNTNKRFIKLCCFLQYIIDLYTLFDLWPTYFEKHNR